MVWRIDDPQGDEAAKVRFDIVPYMGASNIDLGCGPRKVWPNFVGLDNGKDTDLFNIPMRPDMVVGSCERLPMFADGSMDCVFSSHLLEHIEDHVGAVREWWRLVKPGGYLILYLPHADLYPNIGQPGANPDHVHDFRNEDITNVMREVSAGWDLVLNEKRDQLREYSFLQVYRKTAEPVHRHTWSLPKPEKRIGIVRPGAYGDAIWGSAVAHEFKKAGYHVTVYTGHVGRDTLRADPNIDALITMPNGMLDDEEMILYFLWESRKYTKWVNLIGVVEGRMLPHPNEIQFHWPHGVRHARMNRNYHEAMFETAELPMPETIEQRFYPDATEAAWAREQRDKLFPGPLVVLAPTGSGGPKTWPHVQAFMQRMADAGVYVVVVGEIRLDLTPLEPFGVIIGKDLPMRKAMALAQVADAVVGAETGVLNAVASCDMPKVVLMSHSSAQNLTKYWKNTVALEADSLPCHPCHRLHKAFEFCVRDKTTGWSACQAMLGPDLVADVVLKALNLAPQIKAAA